MILRHWMHPPYSTPAKQQLRADIRSLLAEAREMREALAGLLDEHMCCVAHPVNGVGGCPGCKAVRRAARALAGEVSR